MFYTLYNLDLYRLSVLFVSALLILFLFCVKHFVTMVLKSAIQNDLYYYNYYLCAASFKF